MTFVSSGGWIIAVNVYFVRIQILHADLQIAVPFLPYGEYVYDFARLRISLKEQPYSLHRFSQTPADIAGFHLMQLSVHHINPTVMSADILFSN